MIDIHCHILPGVDDGAASIAESILMARQAADQGIRKIIATPHHQNGAYMNPGEHIAGMVDFLNGKIKDANIPVEILPGQETQIYGDVLTDLDKGSVIPLTIAGKFVLIELPKSHIPQFMTQLIFDLQIKEYKPIISNPELNQELIKYPDKLYYLVKNGALTQINAGSIIGREGKKVQRFSERIIQANLTHFIASNAHNSKKQGFYLKDVYNMITKRFGKSTTYEFQANSDGIINDQMIKVKEPEKIISKKIWNII